MAIFGHSEFIPVFWEKLSEKFGMAILAILNLYQFFGENCQKKFGMAIYDHSEFFLTSFLYRSV